jgi:hypothetical protein
VFFLDRSLGRRQLGVDFFTAAFNLLFIEGIIFLDFSAGSGFHLHASRAHRSVFRSGLGHDFLAPTPTSCGSGVFFVAGWFPAQTELVSHPGASAKIPKCGLDFRFSFCRSRIDFLARSSNQWSIPLSCSFSCLIISVSSPAGPGPSLQLARTGQELIFLLDFFYLLLAGLQVHLPGAELIAVPD